jgi:hypothetical protein
LSATGPTGYALGAGFGRIAGITMRQTLDIVFRRENLRRTIKIALVVGTILTVINQLDVFITGPITALTWVKTGLNFCVPFVVSNLGLLAGAGRVGNP